MGFRREMDYSRSRCRVAGLTFPGGSILLSLVSDELDKAILKGVSRSFYLTLRMLPVPMRGAASLAYLLARASDTLADSVAVPTATRLKCLKQFELALTGESPPPRWTMSVLNGTGDDRERRLLERTGEIFEWLEQLPLDEAELVREVVTTIISGQRLDLERFAAANAAHPVALPDDGALNDYARRVAGSVGAFWTKLGFLTLGERFSKLSADDLLESGIAYGKGLQLVNILRDVGRDLAMGRCYLPVDPHDHDQLLQCHKRWLIQAERWLAEGEYYTTALELRRLRVATVLPALLARKTLQPLHCATWRTLQRPIKISRAAVYHSLAEALFR